MLKLMQTNPTKVRRFLSTKVDGQLAEICRRNGIAYARGQGLPSTSHAPRTKRMLRIMGRSLMLQATSVWQNFKVDVALRVARILGPLAEWAANTQRGSINLGGIILLGVAFIMAGLSIRFSSMLINGFAAAWTAANESTVTFVGLTDVIEFGPTIIILGYIIAVGVVGFLGVKSIMD